MCCDPETYTRIQNIPGFGIILLGKFAILMQHLRVCLPTTICADITNGESLLSSSDNGSNKAVTLSTFVPVRQNNRVFVCHMSTDFSKLLADHGVTN